MLRYAIIGLLGLGACGDETLSGYAATDTAFLLTELNGTAPGARVTMILSEGLISGEAPCNAWSAEQTAPYPWFEIGPIAATRAACPFLDVETRFFEALQAMTISEVSGETLILSNTDGGEMVFRVVR